MRKVISAAGLMSAAFYLSIVLLLYLEAKRCEGTSAMFCGMGYVVAGFPWTWLFLYLADVFMEEFQRIEGPLFQRVFVASVLINSLVFYFTGRYVGNAIARWKVKRSSAAQQ